MPTPPRITVVDDDNEMADYLTTLLHEEGGYKTESFPTPGRFFDALIKRKPDLLVLDMGLPGMDGREIIRVIRSNPETKNLLIVAVSGKQIQTADITSGIDTGADEYFLKPVDSQEFLVRIRNLLERRLAPQKDAEEIIELGPLKLSLSRRVCSLGGKDVTLTHMEFDLLLYLLRQSNRALTRSVLLESVWGGTPNMNTRTVDKHMETLRKKLGPFGKKIETVVGIGYIFRP